MKPCATENYNQRIIAMKTVGALHKKKEIKQENQRKKMIIINGCEKEILKLIKESRTKYRKINNL